jgi:uncharacterized protein YndB with AHSA1/START domain/DNA-binding transcriptional ArsR family regulator
LPDLVVDLVEMDAVFRALADPSRRRLLDSLNARNGQRLRDLCVDLDMTRQAVAKHLAVLETAGLVATIRRGREKLHYLNAAPINDIADRWIGQYHRERARALANLKRALEDTMPQTEFVYVTYIKTTPEELWRALTEPEFIRQYFEGTGPQSDWKVGSPVRWRMDPATDHQDWDQKVLVSEPNRRLAYTWHGYQPEMAELFGWSDEQFAELSKEKRSKVSFDIEPAGESTVKLTVIHDDFEPDSEMLKGISQGWPAILSNLKTLLETGKVLSLPA